jgi:hypothetical protein
MLLINGTMGPDHGWAEVTISPLPLSYDTDSQSKVLYNPWIAKDAIIELAILDPAVEYNVTIEARGSALNSSDPSSRMDRIGLHSVTFYSGLG